MVTVHLLPGGDPFAIVIPPEVRAKTSVAADGSAVTVVLQEPGKAPCSLIFPEMVAEQVFGPDFRVRLVNDAATLDGDD